MDGGARGLPPRFPADARRVLGPGSRAAVLMSPSGGAVGTQGARMRGGALPFCAVGERGAVLLAWWVFRGAETMSLPHGEPG